MRVREVESNCLKKYQVYRLPHATIIVRRNPIVFIEPNAITIGALLFSELSLLQPGQHIRCEKVLIPKARGRFANSSSRLAVTIYIYLSVQRQKLLTTALQLESANYISNKYTREQFRLYIHVKQEKFTSSDDTF